MNLPVFSKTVILFAALAASGDAPAQSHLPPMLPTGEKGTVGFQDLSQTPAAYIPKTQAEKRAFKILDSMTDAGGAILIAMNAPAPAERNAFITKHLSYMAPQTANQYLDDAVSFYDETRTRLHSGAQSLTDAQVDAYAQRAENLATVADHGKNLVVGGLNFQDNSKENHLMTRAIILGNSGIFTINADTAKPNNLAKVQSDEARYAINQAQILFQQHGLLDPEKQSIAAIDLTRPIGNKPPLIAQEINALLWEFRALNALVVSGLTNPDPVAKQIANWELDAEQNSIRPAEDRLVEAVKNGTPISQNTPPLGLPYPGRNAGYTVRLG